MSGDTDVAKIRKIEDIIGQLRESFRCPICLDLMKNAVSTKCDHKFCKHCIVLSLGKNQSAPCPLCKIHFTKRSLQPLPQWNSLVNQVGILITAFERDTGVQFSPKKSAFPLSPLSPKCTIYVEDNPSKPPEGHYTEIKQVNINVRSGFPRKGTKVEKKNVSTKINQIDTDKLIRYIEEEPLTKSTSLQDEQIVPNTRSTRNKSMPCNLAAFLENATESQLGGFENNQTSRKVGKNTKRSVKLKGSARCGTDKRQYEDSTSSDASFKVPHSIAENSAVTQKDEDQTVESPKSVQLNLDDSARECNSDTRRKVNHWFTEQCVTPSSLAQSLPHRRLHLKVQTTEGESEELISNKQVIDDDSVYTKDTMTDSISEEDQIASTKNANLDGTKQSNQAQVQIPDDSSVESLPVRRRRKIRKIESTASSVSSQGSKFQALDTSDTEDQKEVSNEQPKDTKLKSKLSYLRGTPPWRFKKEISSPGSDDPYNFKPSQKTPPTKGRKGKGKNNRNKGTASKPNANGKCPVVDVKKLENKKSTDENKNNDTCTSKKSVNVSSVNEKNSRESNGIKTILTYGKEPEMVLFDALQEHNTHPFSSPNDISKNECEEVKVPRKRKTAKTAKQTKSDSVKQRESESSTNVDHIIEEISQAEDYELVFSQQIRDEAEEYRKKLKKKTKDNPRSNRVSFNNNVIVVDDKDEKEVENVIEVINDGSLKTSNTEDLPVTQQNEEKSEERSFTNAAVDAIKSGGSHTITTQKLRRSDPGSLLKRKNPHVLQRRKTRSSDSIKDWSTLKEMNRDLQPKLARKRPVAEVTPSKSSKPTKRKKTIDHSDTDVDDVMIVEVNSADTEKNRDSGSETESLQSDEEQADYEKPNLDIQPPNVKEMLSQMSSGGQGRKRKANKTEMASSLCIPESNVDSQEDREDVSQVETDESKSDAAFGASHQNLESSNITVGESLGFEPLLSQKETQHDMIKVEISDLKTEKAENEEPAKETASTSEVDDTADVAEEEIATVDKKVDNHRQTGRKRSFSVDTAQLNVDVEREAPETTEDAAMVEQSDSDSLQKEKDNGVKDTSLGVNITQSEVKGINEMSVSENSPSIAAKHQKICGNKLTKKKRRSGSTEVAKLDKPEKMKVCENIEEHTGVADNQPKGEEKMDPRKSRDIAGYDIQASDNGHKNESSVTPNSIHSSLTNDRTPVGKLVKRRRSESDSSEEENGSNKSDASPFQRKTKRMKSRKISDSSQDESNTETDAEAESKNKRKQKKVNVSMSRGQTPAKTDKRIKTKKNVDSSDGSDSDEELKPRRRSGVRAVRGLASLSMSQKTSSPTVPKQSSPYTPEISAKLSLWKIKTMKESNVCDDADEECEITMVEGTPQVTSSMRLGKFLSSQAQRKGNLNRFDDAKGKPSQNKPAGNSSTKIETQSQEIISDTPNERTTKPIFPKRQKGDEAEDCVPPTPPKAERTLNSTFHIQPVKVPTGKILALSTQASSLEQDSESLIQPKTLVGSQEIANRETSEAHTGTKTSETSKGREENRYDSNLVVKEEPPWQVKYSPDGKQILRAAPTTPHDPVEVEDRDVDSHLERSKVQENIMADLALIASVKKNKNSPAKKKVQSPKTSGTFGSRSILLPTHEKKETPGNNGEDENLPSLEAKEENAEEWVESIETESEDDEMDIRKTKHKSRKAVISSDEDSESEASVTSSKALNVTSSSMSDVDTQMIQTKHVVEADILRIQEQLELMKQQYKEAVGFTKPQNVSSQENPAGPSSESTEQKESTHQPKSIDLTEPNMTGGEDVATEEIDDQGNIETIDPGVVLPETVEPSEEYVSSEHNEDMVKNSQTKDRYPKSSCSQSVVQESDQEIFSTPRKENLSQKSRLSLSGRKKRKRSSSDVQSPPACTSTPKASTQNSDQVRASAESPAKSPVKSPTPPNSCDGDVNHESCEPAERISDDVQGTNVFLAKYKSVSTSEDEKQTAVSSPGVKKILLKDNGDLPADCPKRLRLQNESEKENWKRLSLNSKVEVSPALGSVKSSGVRSSLSPTSSTNTSLSHQPPVDFPKHTNWCLTISGIKRAKDKKLIRAFCSHLGCPLVEKYSQKVTHIIMKPVEPGKLKCEWTLKYFQGVTGGKWVISAQWIFDCMREGILLPEEKYEIDGDTNNETPTYAPFKARTTNVRIMSHLEVCCAGQFVNLPREELHNLLDSLGARVVQEPSMFTYDEGLEQIILVDSSEPNFDQKKMIKEGRRRSAHVVEKNWILNSIGSFEVKKPEEFSI